jgi:hypothetical protein
MVADAEGTDRAVTAVTRFLGETMAALAGDQSPRVM